MKNLYKPGIVVVALMVFFTACGPSAEEISAAETQEAANLSNTQTAAAPTITPSPTPTPTHTPTPIPPTPTPTPLPDPDAKAMLNWEALNLPSNFRATSAKDINIGEGEIAFTFNNDLTILIEKPFVFSDEDRPKVFGYTFLLPTRDHHEGFEYIVDNIQSMVESSPQNYGATAILDSGMLTDLNNVGGLSAGATVGYELNSEVWRLEAAIFRVDDIGALIFVRYKEADGAPVAIEHLARVYAQSIMYPEDRCKLVSVTPVEDAQDWPAFKISAEGFFPGEGRVILLSGDVQIEGDTKSVATALLGLEGQSADSQGRIEETVAFQVVQGDNVIPPTELELTIIGYYSGCEIEENLSWPMEQITYTPTPNTIPTPNTTPTSFLPFRDDFEQLLEPGWIWIREDPFLWNLNEKPGFLRIYLSPQDRGQDEASNKYLLRHAPEGNFEITTRVLISPFTNFHSAGLIIMQDEGHQLRFTRAHCFLPTLPGHCVSNGLYFDYQNESEGVPNEGYLIGPNYATRTLSQSEAILKITREGRIYTAYFSEDGETWVTIGRHEVDILPMFVGLFTSTDWNHPTTANYDYFTLETLP